MKMLKSIFTAFIISMPLLLNAQIINNDTIKEGEKIYSTVGLAKVPEYPGGMNAFYEYISKNFRMPSLDNDLNAKIFVSFVVEKDGTLTDIKVVRDPGYGLAKEAKRVLAAVPEKWSPGIMDGKPVRVNYSLPIAVNFKAPNPKKKQE